MSFLFWVRRAVAYVESLVAPRRDTKPYSIDPFHIDPAIVPEGWEYQWNVLTVLGQEQVQLKKFMANGGWHPVPFRKHARYFPGYERDGEIHYGGQRLERRLKAENTMRRSAGSLEEILRYHAQRYPQLPSIEKLLESPRGVYGSLYNDRNPVKSSPTEHVSIEDIVLTQREIEAATDGTIPWNHDDIAGSHKKGDPIGIDEYKRRKAIMTKEDRYDVKH